MVLCKSRHFLQIALLLHSLKRHWTIVQLIAHKHVNKLPTKIIVRRLQLIAENGTEPLYGGIMTMQIK